VLKLTLKVGCLPYALYSLATVNFFLFCVGATQVSRIALYNQSQKNSTIPKEAKQAAEGAAEKVGLKN
jgi:hypothetical protein